MSEQKDLVAEGYYDVKVKSFGSDLSKQKGTPFAWVKFENGVFWQGYQSDAQMKNGKSVTQSTVEQLVTMGFRGANFDDLNKEGALNTDNAVNIQVTHETAEDGVVRAKAQWVNALYKKKELDPSATQKLKGIDVRGLVAAAKKDLGIDDSNDFTPQPKTDFTADDIPF